METFSALLALCGGIHPSSVNSSHKGQWRGALIFSLICAWINGWVNNRETDDLRHHRAHYDVIVIKKIARKSCPIQCVELDHQSGSRKQHCWKFWNLNERIVVFWRVWAKWTGQKGLNAGKYISVSLALCAGNHGALWSAHWTSNRENVSK